eukprot:scaffold2102_cov161-Amphora_coffeaeformis.AAC.13
MPGVTRQGPWDTWQRRHKNKRVLLIKNITWWNDLVRPPNRHCSEPVNWTESMLSAPRRNKPCRRLGKPRATLLRNTNWWNEVSKVPAMPLCGSWNRWKRKSKNPITEWNKSRLHRILLAAGKSMYITRISNQI